MLGTKLIYKVVDRKLIYIFSNSDLHPSDTKPITRQGSVQGNHIQCFIKNSQFKLQLLTGNLIFLYVFNRVTLTQQTPSTASNKEAF